MQLKLTRRIIPAFAMKQLSDCKGNWREILSSLKWWIKGYSTQQIRYWKLGTGPLPAARALYRYRLTLGTNQHVWPILHDKLLFDTYMRGKVPIVSLLGVIQNGNPAALTIDPAYKDWRQAVEEHQAVVIKPLQGGEGSGLLFLNREQGSYSMNGKPANEQEIDTRLAACDWHGIYPFISQHADLAACYPSVTNTIRIISAPRHEGGIPEPICARLRIGTARSHPTDTFERGGLAARIDMDTGLTTAAIMHDGHTARSIAQHPETGAPLIGITIPYWREILAMLSRFLQQNAAFDFVGWDVLIAPNDFYVLEANHNPGLMTAYIFHNANDEEPINAFFRARNLI